MNIVVFILTQWIIKTSGAFFINICTTHFICKGSKRLLKVCVWERAGDRTETAVFWPPLLWPSTLCLSRSPGPLNRRPRGSLCWVMAYFTASYQYLLWSPNSIGFPEGPFGWVWLSLPHLVYLRLQLYCNWNCHFIVRVWKGCVGFYCERELETEQKLQYFDPHSYGRQRCVFLVLLMLNRRPRGPLSAGWWLSLLHLSSIFSGPQLIWAPSPFGLVWLSLPQLVYHSYSNCNLNCLDFCLDWVI